MIRYIHMENNNPPANKSMDNVEPLIFPKSAKTRIWRPPHVVPTLSRQPVLRVVK